MKLVLVYSGEKLPRYHIENLSLIASTFPSRDTLTIVDSLQCLNALLEHGHTAYLVRSDFQRFGDLEKRLTHSRKFWNGFWFKTIKRFYMLYEYLQQTNSKEVLHVESDVLLLPNFPFETLQELDCTLAYPLVTKSTAAASVMFVKDKLALEDFLDFIESDQLDSQDTDMSLLFKYAELNEKVCILPSDAKPGYLRSTPDGHLDRFRDVFEGLFDGATYGQYLFGIDPRNNLGIRRLFSNPEDHIVKPNLHNYFLAKSGDSFTLLVNNSENQQIPIYNLHIHSKDIRVFKMRFDKPLLLLNRCLDSNNHKVVREFVVSAFFYSHPVIFKSLILKVAKLLGLR